MTQPATHPTMEQLVAALATANTALKAAKAATATARTAWDGALLAWKIIKQRTVVRPGRPAPTPPAAPTGAQLDLTGLATALVNAEAAQETAQTAFNAAAAAHTAALVAAGAA